MRAVAVVLVVALLALSGCVGLPGDGETGDNRGPVDVWSAATPTPESTSTASRCATVRETVVVGTDENGSISVARSHLPVDAGRIYDRTAAMQNVSDPPTPRVLVRCPENVTVPVDVPPFLARLGLDFEGESVWLLSFSEGRDVRISSEATEEESLPYVLAHEFTHVLQVGPQNFSRQVDAALGEDRPGGVDEDLLRRSLAEGGAEYAADAYWQRHVGTTPSPVRDVVRRYPGLTGGLGLYRQAPHRYGYRYLNARNVSTANLSAVYADPPRTTEELLHGLAPGSEPPANLAVSVAVDGWEHESLGRVGELATRQVLRTELNASDAAKGADGWGEDRLLRFERNGSTGYAWALRWDDRANASEFATLFRQYLAARGEYAPRRWRDGDTDVRLRWSGGRTTVVLLGDSQFVSNATATGSHPVVVAGG